MAHSRAEIISELKRRGVKGRLSKMRKHELEDLLGRSKPGLSLEDAPEEKKRSSGSTYHAFVRENLKKHGGDMRAVAAAYREQKGGGEDVEGGGFIEKAGKAVGKAAAQGAIGVAKGVAAAAKEAMDGGGDAHGESMEATHSYCDSQKGGADDDIDQYMEGGSYWDEGKKKT